MTKKILNYEFEFVTDIKPEKNERGEIISYDYKAKAESEGKRFNTYGNKTFCKIKLNLKNDMQGLYALFVNDELMYVGETHDLKARWSSTGYGSITYKNSLIGGQTTNCMVNSFIYESAVDEAKIELYFCEHISAERKLIMEEKPKLNKILNLIKNS